MIIIFAVVIYMAFKFHFVVIFTLMSSQTFTIDLKAFFISLNMILTLKSFIQLGPLIFHKKFLTPYVAVNFLDETKYSISIYITCYPTLDVQY